ncbi:MAG: hypothetical protein ACOCZ6_04505 [Nanoarchaeota archaeon]
MYNRAQTSVELLLLIAMSLVVILGILAYSTDSIVAIDSIMRTETGNKMLDDIQSTANDVYRQGSGARDIIHVSMPENIENITIDEINESTRLSINYITGNMQYRDFDFGIAGEIPVTKGRQKLELEAIPGAVVIAPEVDEVIEDYMPVCGDGEIGLGQECDPGNETVEENIPYDSCSDFFGEGTFSGELQCTDCLIDTRWCGREVPEDCKDIDDCDRCTSVGCIWCEGGPAGRAGCIEKDADGCHQQAETVEEPVQCP